MADYGGKKVYTSKPGSGSMFSNERKEKDTHPDLSGSINLGQVEGPDTNWFSGWFKCPQGNERAIADILGIMKAANVRLSVSVGNAKQQQGQQAAQSQPAYQSAGGYAQAPQPQPQGQQPLNFQAQPNYPPQPQQGYAPAPAYGAPPAAPPAGGYAPQGYAPQGYQGAALATQGGPGNAHPQGGVKFRDTDVPF